MSSPRHRGDARIDLGVGALEVGVGDHSRTAVAWSGDEHGVEIPVADHPVEVGIDEIEPWRVPQ